MGAVVLLIAQQRLTGVPLGCMSVHGSVLGPMDQHLSAVALQVVTVHLLIATVSENYMPFS